MTTSLMKRSVSSPTDLISPDDPQQVKQLLAAAVDSIEARVRLQRGVGAGPPASTTVQAPRDKEEVKVALQILFPKSLNNVAKPSIDFDANGIDAPLILTFVSEDALPKLKCPARALR